MIASDIFISVFTHNLSWNIVLKLSVFYSLTEILTYVQLNILFLSQLVRALSEQLVQIALLRDGY